ncbi:MAG TPA: hypothetical protein DDZ22_18700 [Massilia sp.]|nr:hypothetical protein [Massilia sp.]
MFFNNLANRNHKNLYGADAFYDLETSGYQSGLAKDLCSGDLCIVANYEDKDRTMVKFACYSFARETLEIDKQGKPQRVLRGHLKSTEILRKTAAASDPRYSRMFDKLGRFKQAPVVAMAA